MNAINGDFALVWPGAAEASSWASQNGAGFGIDKELE